MILINLPYKRIYFLLVILVGLTQLSCKKLIEIPANPSNQLSIERVFSDSTNIIAAVSAVYVNYGTTSYSPQFGSGTITVNTGLTGDELVPGANTYTAPAFYTNLLLPDNSGVRSMWSDAYKNIFQMNVCIEGITGTAAISAGLKRRLIGELKVNRAFYYFNMVNIWGGVPIVTSTDYKVTQSSPRASVTEVYNFILSDLIDAQQSLTAEYPSNGHIRPNLYTAQALLAKVYLYLGQYQNAIVAANSVIGNGGFKLADINDVFLDGSEEAIWQLPANGTYYQTPEAATFLPYSSSYQPNYVLSPQLLAAFETGDLRKANWTNFSTVTVGGVPTLYYYPYKYKKITAGQAPIEDYALLRLADIYLVRAEAFARTEKLAEARTDLNKVRLRANLGEVTSNVKEVVLSAILHERQVEMFCEWGNRWFDLKRTNTIDAVLSAAKPTWKSSAALFPIPIAEIQANPALQPN
ncbi:RagB/SusD family nutrient uptake outer membrane protein [Pedobacter sp. MC2016-14]|uniref:RagB/SusD family nutrient uptake outer membrane protein n=1 Tax=Pedobacter sp. MC2016-14 TaxID=2897327 RepID=UPI001E43EBE9|nr:RagB/SusD family nutrient uptake outer membrane protein [Pedobacter sp. MC2016-14]MCD0489894.1 RagB/SusD family nutrient uptake outer membrane protein [Pedobacter sp. MC2016-14]